MLSLANGRPLMQKKLSMIIQTDASMTSLRAHCNEIPTGGKWSKKEVEDHMNIFNRLKFMAVRLAILTFMKTKSKISIHLQIEGGYPQQTFKRHKQVNMAIPLLKTDQITADCL